MGHTNETNNLHLPQFVATDKPTFLGDINGAMLAIDNAYGTISAEATGAASTAQTAATAAASAVETASGAVATAQQAATDATAAAGVAQTAADTANNAQSTAVLAKQTADNVNTGVGELADLDTTDKSSIVAAINEVVSELPTTGGYVETTGDNTKTYQQLLNELYALADKTKISRNSILSETASGIEQFFHLGQMRATSFYFDDSEVTPNSYLLVGVVLSETGSTKSVYNGTAWTEQTSSPVASTHTLRLYY